MASGSVSGDAIIVGHPICRVIFFGVELQPLVSVAVTLIVKLPVCAGIPVIRPSVLILIPCGSVPEFTVKLYGAVPPDAVNWPLTLLPAVNPLIPLLETVISLQAGCDEIVIVIVPLPVHPLASVAVALNENVPAAVGVPLIVPLLLSVRPAGNVLLVLKV